MADLDGLKKHAYLFRRGGGLAPPPEVLLSWPAANYTNPETHGDVGPVLVIVFLALSIMFYLARMWARVFLTKTSGLDDWIMTAAIIPLIGAAVAVVLACRTYGYQWHVWDQTQESLISTRQIILVIEVLYLLATSLIKISILCFYRRITTGTISKAVMYWIWGSIAFVAAYFFAFAFTLIFSCSPIEAYWRYFDLTWRLTHEVKCNNEGAEIVAVVIFSTLLDFYICAFPVVLIWNLQITKRQKAALCGIFGVGLLTCVCGVMRAYYATYVYYFTYDITWYAWYGWIWTALEAQLGVMCACAPALKGFFHRYFAASNRSNAYGYGTGQQSSNGQSPGYGKLSRRDSLATTDAERGRSDSTNVPLNRIKVSTTTDIVEDMDESRSFSSNESTKNLTESPVIAKPPPIFIDEGRTSIWDGTQRRASAVYRGHVSAAQKEVQGV